ncbi:retention module-containing protein [Aeromonas veronii]|uniref:retention module-containing protein n=2 Tax=Aeromonas veronii TaxID=654 RepID=UPI002B2A58AF|nr:hypothetical protein VAWG002_08190 [Aeromonas veronii]
MITNAVTLEQGVTVTQLKGQIYLVAADGSRKLLAEGDVLPKGAVIMSPDGASFMGGGQSFNVQPASEQSEPAEEGDAPQLAQNGAAGTPDDISALQQAILGGADPTQAFEASAAGGAPAAGGGGIGGVAGASGNGGFVTIDRTGSATIAEATFDTTYNANGEPPQGAAGEDEPLFISANLVLSADTQVNEGGLITFTATLDELVFGSDLVIQLSNGAVITIPVGQSSGSVTVAAPADSPYIDPSTITVSITGTLGSGFNQIITGPSTTTQINDTVDTTTVTLGAPAQVNEGGQITYSASVNNAPQSDLVLTLSNGASITIKAGELSGSVTVDAPIDDVYKDGSSLTVNITGSQGGNYEQLDTSSTVTTVVGDTVDTTTVTLSSVTNGLTVTEGGSIVYTASVNNPVTGSPLTVTLSNGVVITIPVGSSSANSEPFSVREDDAYHQGNETLSVTIDETSGGNYESVATTGTITNTVVDDNDTAFTLKLFAVDAQGNVVDSSTVSEEGETSAYYVVRAVDANGNVLATQPTGNVNVSFGNLGTTSSADYSASKTTVAVGEVFSAKAVNDALADNGEQFKVSLNGGSFSEAGKYEKVEYSDATVTTTITDETGNDPDVPGDNDTAFTLKLFAVDAQGNVVDSSTVSEEGETSAYYVVRAVDANGNVLATQPTGNVNVSFGNLGTTSSADYSASKTTVAVGEVFSAKAVNDALADNGEQFKVSLNGGSFSEAGKYEKVEYSDATVTTTITDETGNDPDVPGDNDTAFTLKLFAVDAQGNVVDSSTVSEEGETSAYYVVRAVDANGNVLATQPTGNVNVSFGNLGTTSSADYSASKTTVAVGEVFSAKAVNDALADNGEQFKVSLNGGSFSEAGKYEKVEYSDATVTTTITDETGNDPDVPGDNDTAFTLKLFAVDAQGNVVDSSTVSEEGETSAYYVVRAVDANGNVLATQPTGNVNVSFGNLGTTSSADYSASKTTVAVGEVFSAKAVNDALADNGEQFKVSLNGGSFSEAGKYEKVEYSDATVTTTITDETGNDPDVPGDNDTAFTLKLFAVDAQGNVVDSSTVSEEGETSAYYVVRAVDANGNVLATQPTGNVNVSFGNLGTTSSADYSASKTTVAVGEVFSAKAVNDALADNGEQFKVSLNGGSFSEAGKYEKVEYSDATVTTTITDETGNDPDVPGDNDTAFTLKLFAVDAQGNVVDSSTVSEEGETSAYYVVRAVDANGNVLATQPTGNVNVSFGNLGTTSSADYSASKTTVAVGEVFSAKAVNDALADNGEQFKVSLNGGSFSEAGKYEKVEYSDATVTTTITDETGNDPDVPGDNDTAFTLKLFAVDAQGNVVDSSTVSEEGETSAYYVVRAVDANGNVLATQPTGNVNVSFGNLGTTSSADYSASKTTVAVGEVFSAKAVNDALADNGEQFKVSLNGGSFSEAGKYEKVEYSDATVTTTITDETGNDPDVPGDNDTAFTLKLFAVDAQGNVVDSSTVSEEGETSAYYVVRAVDANGNVLATQPTGNVNVSFGNLGTTSSADYSASKTTVAVGEVFSAKAVNDALADNGEQFKVSLNGGSFSEAGKYEKVEYSDATVTTTITDETGNDPDVPGDNDTAFTLKLFAVDAQGNVVDSSTVSEEGETSAYYVVRAVDANGNVLATQPTGNVNVSFGNLGTTSSADYSASKTTVAVGEVFSAKAVNDALADNGEQFKVSLNGGSFSEAGKYEKVEYSDATVTTTITDETGNDPDVPGDNDTAFTLKLFAVDAQGNVVDSSTVSEEGETSAYYVVRAVDANGNVLATQPTGNVNVSFGNLGTTSSADYSASKTTVAVGEVFSAKAVNDALADNGEQFKVSLNGGSFSEAGKYEKVEYSDATVTTTITDETGNDPDVPGDNDTAFTLKLFAVDAQGNVVDSSTVSEEGETSAYYVVRAVDANGNVLATQPTGNVNVSFGNLGTTSSADYSASKTTVAVGEVFSAKAVNDALADNGEQFKVSLNGGSFSEAGKYEKVEYSDATVTTTITDETGNDPDVPGDNDTAFTLKLFAVDAQGNVVDSSTVSEEGETSAYYVVRAVDANGNVLATQPTGNVNVSFGNLGTTSSADYSASKTTVAVGEVFSAKAVNDALADNGEQFKVSLNGGSFSEAGKYEKVEYSDATVTTTITDETGNDPDVPGDNDTAFTLKLFAVDAQGNVVDSSTVSEEGETSAYYVVRAVDANGNVLATQPTGNVNVSFGNLGTTSSADYSASKTTVAVGEVFSAKAVNDALADNGEQFKVSLNGGSFSEAGKYEKVEYSDATVTTTITDETGNDPDVPGDNDTAFTLKLFAVDAQGNVVDSSTVSEEGETSAYYVVRAVDANGNVLATQPTGNVNVSFGNLGTTSSADYSASKTTVAVGEVFSAKAVNDALADNGEQFKVSLNGGSFSEAGKYEKVEYSDATVTTTITDETGNDPDVPGDNDTAFTLKLFAVDAQGNVVDSSTVSEEGETSAYYVVRAVDANGNVLATQPTGNVNVSFGNLGTTSSADYSASKTTVAVGEVFSAKAVNDALADNGEQFKVSLNGGSFSEAGKYEKVEYSDATVTTTITDETGNDPDVPGDNDTAFTLKLFAVDAQGNVVDSSTVSEEGETSAYYVVRAVDANGNVLATQPTGNVNVSFGNLGTTSSADYSASKTTVAVGEVFSAKAVNDALADNGEQFKVSLNGGSFSEAGKYEKVEYSDATVTTTITDETGNDPDVPGDNDTAFTLKLFAVDAQGNVVDSSTVSEEGETSAYYVVRAVDANGNVLATQPTGNVNVSFGNLGTTSSADYSASKTTVAVGEVFSAKAVNDALADNGEQFKVSLNGGSFSEAGKYEKVEYSDATVTTTITDETGNDPDVPGDNDTAFTLKLFAVDAQGNVVDSSTVSEEGETSAYYVVRAVDANGNVLATQPTGNVNVSFGNLGTTSSADYSASKTTVAVGEVFSAKAVNDALADNGEQFKVSLNGGSFSEAGKYEKVEYSDATVTTTITDETGNDPDVPGDNDTAFTLKLFAVDAQGNVVDSSTVSEEGETSAYYVVRAVDANGNVLATQPTGNVNVSFGNLGTTSSADYSASKTTVAVGEVFSAKAVNDALADNGEQFKVSLNGGSFSEAGKYEKVEYSDATVTTTITDETGNDPDVPGDNDTAFTLKLFAVDAQGNVVDSSTVSEEGETSAYYVVRAVDANGNVLATQPTGNVNVSFGNLGTTSSADYSASKTTVAVGEVFSAKAVNDALADNGEQFKVSLNGGSFSEAGKYEKVEYSDATVTTTITDETGNDPDVPGDNDTAFTLKLFAVDAQGNVVDSSTVSEEGETSAYYVVRAVDANGNVLATQPTGNVNVSFGNLGTTSSADYSASKTTVAVGEVFSAKAVNDALADNGEQFKVSLNGGSFSEAGKYEKVEYSDATVTTTITDETGNDPDVPGDNDTAFTLKLFAVDAQGNVVDSSTVSEEGETSAYYVVRAVDANGNVLATQPTGNVNVSFGNLGTTSSADYSASKTTVAVGEVFSAKAVNDALADNGEQFKVSLNGGSFSEAGKYEKVEYSDATVTTTITDETGNDPDVPGDNDTAFTLKLFAVDAQGNVVDSSTVSEEGETSAYYVVRAVDANGNVLATQPTGNVNVSFGNLGTTSSADYSASKTTVAVGEVFSAKAVNDALADNGEQFKVSLNGGSFSEAGKYEKVEYSDATVTTTILDNDSLVALQDVVEGTSNNVLNVADGVAFTGATALGGTVSLVNGKYVYQAPVRDHADLVADTDSFTYTKADGSTVTYTINILDTNPIAAKDSGSVAVGLNVQTSGSASLLANDTVVDSSSANPAKVYSVTGLNGQAMVLDASGSVTVAGKYGDLTVSADGSYTYTSKLDTDVQAVEGGPAVKSAFAVYGFLNNSLPLNGTSLNLTGLTDSATALVDVRTSGNNAKPGIGVSQSGGGTNDIGSGESLVIGLKALSNFAQIGINELNSGQGSASWKAYDANGVLVGSGILVSSSSNGGLQSFNISTNTPFQYLVLGYSGNQNGYVVDSIKYTPAIGAVTEEFTYTVKDNDGDVSNSAVLTLNGNVPTTVAPTMLMGVEDTDVPLTWASFGISDNASTVRISGNQDGTGTIRYLDASTNQYKELGKNETKTFTKADIDSGKVKFDPEDNVSGADVYGNDKGVGNKGHDLTSIKFDVLKGNQVIASDKSVVVDLTPKADAPTLKVGTFSSLAAMDFENVGVGTGGWKDNINPNSINGAGAIGQWHANGSGLIEVGKESVYLGNKATSTTNQVMEIESSRNVSQLYTDIQCESGRFYQLNFDISARTTDGIKIETCGLKVYLIQIVNGQPVSGERIELYDFSPKSVGWLKGQSVGLNVPETGTYRLVFESKDASGNGDSYGAVLDNVKFQAVDNKGYEDSFIKLGKIEAELVDRDDSERLSVEIEGLPVGAVLKDAANHIVIVKDDTHKVDVTGWSLSTLQLKVNDPGHYNLVVKATAKEVTSSGTVLDSAVSTVILPVEVLPEGNTIKTGELNDSVYLSSDRPSVAAHTAIEINGIHYSQPGIYLDGTAGVVINKDSADTVYTYGGNDHVEGGRGNDVVYLGNSGSNPPDLSKAIDFVTADVATITLRPADGVAREDGDLIPAKASVNWGDVAQGAQGNDFLFGEDGVDLLFGGSGNDYLDGGKDRDFIRGGSGDDVILGGAGSDYLRGEEGADTFLWQQGDDALVQGSGNSNMLPTHPVDYITDFQVQHGDGWQLSSNKANYFKDVDIARSDKLDLSDLLDHSGNKNESNLATLLSVFEKEGDVHLQVKTADGSKVRQEIVLLDSTFESITGDHDNHVHGSTGSTSEQVINYMLQNHLLDIDK